MQPSTMLMNLARVLLTPVTLGDRRIDLPYVTAEASRVREILGTDAVESSSCSVEALNRDLSGKKVWVFLGHTDAPLCGDRTLAFSRDGVIEVVQISTIVEIVRSHQLDLVVLNGCNGAQLAEELLGAGVPIVVYWSTMVHDEAAKMFSVGFFQALAAGSSYARAFDAGRVAVLTCTQEGTLDTGRRAMVQKFVLEDPAPSRTQPLEYTQRPRRAAAPMAAGVPQLLMNDTIPSISDLALGPPYPVAVAPEETLAAAAAVSHPVTLTERAEREAAGESAKEAAPVPAPAARTIASAPPAVAAAVAL